MSHAVPLLCVAAAFLAADDDLPAPEAVTPQRYVAGIEFAEGPALDAAGNLYLPNFRERGIIGRVTPDRTASVFCDLRKIAPAEDREPWAGGLKVDRRGRLIVADFGAGRLLRVAADGVAAEVLAESFRGLHFRNINDVALDTAGNVYFTDSGRTAALVLPGAVYRYDAGTGQVTRLDDGLKFPNGLAVAPDQKHLCVGESSRRRLLVYALEDEGRTAARKMQIELAGSCPPGSGRTCAPDGMVFDAAGRLYVAMYGGALVNVIDVFGGKLLRQYPAGSRATNCHFHGGFLYVTVAAEGAVYRLDLGVEGFDYNGK